MRAQEAAEPCPTRPAKTPTFLHSPVQETAHGMLLLTPRQPECLADLRGVFNPSQDRILGLLAGGSNRWPPRVRPPLDDLGRPRSSTCGSRINHDLCCAVGKTCRTACACNCRQTWVPHAGGGGARARLTRCCMHTQISTHCTPAAVVPGLWVIRDMFRLIPNGESVTDFSTPRQAGAGKGQGGCTSTFLVQHNWDDEGRQRAAQDRVSRPLHATVTSDGKLYDA